MTALLARLGGVFVRPRTTLRSIAAGGGGDPLEALLVYLVVQLAVAGRVVYKALALTGEAPKIALKRAYESLWMLARNDLVTLVVVAVLLLALGFVTRRGEASARALVAAACYLALPVALLKALGAAAMWLGADQWWLPHHPVDSYVVFVKGRVAWGRFAVKCLVAYGPSALLLADLVVALLRRRLDVAPRHLGVARAAGAVVVGVVVAVAAGSVADVVAQRATLRPRLPGDAIPDVALPWLKGAAPEGSSMFRPRDFGGKVLVLDFWASWCAPCRRSMPELDALARELRKRGLVVVGVNREPYDQAAARGTLDELEVAFPSAVDARGFGEKLGLSSLPTSYVVDRRGVLRHLHLGYTDVQKIREEVLALLAEE